MSDEAVRTVDDAAPGDADAALDVLVEELSGCVESLRHVLARAEELRGRRRDGAGWSEVVQGEDRPLIVERISAALETLGSAGSRWRRDEARALHADGMSISRIAELFGVTRQRASVLVRDPDRT
ncbi:helix-turn-helix domain-containing protein [Actinomycetospora atypica]|uniref:Helix-turn-helix domain-containing protein n=1 Tax=Actinomycetospora atypica TaxID=1290095 RepID=A0ABV9YIN7_9PSEU